MIKKNQQLQTKTKSNQLKRKICRQQSIYNYILNLKFLFQLL